MRNLKLEKKLILQKLKKKYILKKCSQKKKKKQCVLILMTKILLKEKIKN